MTIPPKQTTIKNDNNNQRNNNENNNENNNADNNIYQPQQQ